MSNSKYVPYYKAAGTKTTKEWYELFVGRKGEVAVIHKLEYQTIKKGKVHSTNEAVVRVKWIEKPGYVNHKMYNTIHVLYTIIHGVPDRNGMLYTSLPNLDSFTNTIESLLSDKGSLLNSIRFGMIFLRFPCPVEEVSFNFTVSY